MKAIIKVAIFVLMAANLTPLAAQVQSKNEQRTRALFVNKRADAMRIVILKSEGTSLVPVDPSQSFKEGDQIKVAFESNFEGYVYLINVTPGGKKRVLFPTNSESSNAVRPGQRYEFPSGKEIIEFDAEKGIEVLQVIMSRERIPLLDGAIKNSSGDLGDSASSAAAELQGGLSGDKVTKVLPDQASGGVRARNIILAQGKDKDKEGSVVAISDNSGAASKLESGDAAVFEIRLKHN